MRRLVLRFEQSDGCGVYYGGGVANDYVEAERHPLPEQDGGLRQWYEEHNEEGRYNYLFGFGTLAQARAWFYNWDCLEAMQADGDRLKVYAVENDEDAVVVGYSQTVFRIAEAELVAEFDPTMLHHPEFDTTLDKLYNVVNNTKPLSYYIDAIKAL